MKGESSIINRAEDGGKEPEALGKGLGLEGVAMNVQAGRRLPGLYHPMGGV